MGEIKRSYKARLATTRSMTAQYRVLEAIVKNKAKEVAKVESYEKYNLEGYEEMLQIVTTGYKIASSEKRDYLERIQNAYEQGIVLKIKGVTQSVSAPNLHDIVK